MYVQKSQEPYCAKRNLQRANQIYQRVCLLYSTILTPRIEHHNTTDLLLLCELELELTPLFSSSKKKNRN